MKKKDDIEVITLIAHIVLTLISCGIAAYLIWMFCEISERPGWWIFGLCIILALTLVFVWTGDYIGTSYPDTKPRSDDHYRDGYDSSRSYRDGGFEWHRPSYGNWPSITDDYYGHRGEFDSNDRDRAYSEDMQQMRQDNPNADLEDHFGWDNLLSYETDDYDKD